MKKILIFGCSFSRGSYEEYTWPDEPRLDRYIEDSKGWWYFVDYFKDNNVTIIACPGQGYWAFYQILLYLEENKRIKYDEIWIQETTEPRCTLNTYKDITKSLLLNITYFDNSFTLRQISPKPGGDHSEISNDTEPYVDNYTFFINLTKSCSYNIDKLCKEKNIKGYVWSMYKPIMENNHFKRLPLKYIRQELKNKSLLVPGDYLGNHQTEEGNKYIAKLIDKACIDIKI